MFFLIDNWVNDVVDGNVNHYNDDDDNDDDDDDDDEICIWYRYMVHDEDHIQRKVNIVVYHLL